MQLELGMRSTAAMSDVLHKFPSTPHLAWLGKKPVRDDKVMSPAEVIRFLSDSIVVEEKLDGANLGISIGPDDKLRFQNRGNWLNGKLVGQWNPLRGWIARCEPAIREVLPANHILFGEWCYARHSIGYRRLPDLFSLFDVYDVSSDRFWSAARRDDLAKKAGLVSVPQVAVGKFRQEELVGLLDDLSAYGDAQREGIYLRKEVGGWLAERAKLVAPVFTQTILEHWSRGALVVNEVAGSAYRAGNGESKLKVDVRKNDEVT